MVWLLVILLANPAPNAPAAAGVPPALTVPRAKVLDMLTQPDRRIRTMDGRAQALLLEGARRSQTFAALVAAIQTTDVIVYVESAVALPPDIAGRLLLQASTGADRYLRIHVRARLPVDQAIAVLAHELRHAIEVADDASVVDDESLTALYRRIGEPSRARRGYDTQAARDAGAAVRAELTRRTAG